MAYSEYLAERVTQFFMENNANFYTRKMFGSLCFMVNEKMCVGVMDDEIMARIHPDKYESSLLKEGCREMDFTGKALKGYVYLMDEAIDLDNDLYYWLQLALDFNPFAKASKKRKSSKN